MVNVYVAEIARKAYTYEDGIQVFSAVAKAFDSNEKVVLSFSKVESIPSSFANGCFVKLLEFYGFDRIKSDLKIEDSTRQINKMIKERLIFESNRVRE